MHVPTPPLRAPTRIEWNRAAIGKLSALVGLALVMRLPNLTESLWYDELWATRVLMGNVGDMIRVTFADVHPPLYGFLAFASMQVFGDSELAVRALPLLAGLATVALLPSLGAALAIPRAGWIAGVLLALSPVHIWYSQEARPYSLIMLVSVLLVLQWQRLQEQPVDRLSRVLYVVLAVALAQLHFFGVALPAALVAVALLERRNQGVAVLAFASSLGSVLTLLALKSLDNELTLEGSYLQTFTPSELWQLFQWLLLGGSAGLGAAEQPYARIGAWWMIVVGITMLLWWLVSGTRSPARDRWLTLSLIVLAMPGFLLFLTAIGRTSFYINRSAVVVLPFLLLAICGGFYLIRENAFRRGAIVATTVAAVAVLLRYHSRRDEWTVYKPNPDWPSIVTDLERERGAPSQPLLAFSTTPLREIEYYMPEAAECPWPPREPVQRVPSLGFRGTLGRMFPRSEELTCGANGTAFVRLYVARDSSAGWVDSVRAHESGANAVVIYNAHWAGRTRALLRSLGANGHSIRPVARARGLEVFAID